MPDALLQAALDEIAITFDGRRRSPVAVKVRLARKYWREAWKLRAGLPVGDDAGGTFVPAPGTAEKWAPRLRAQALGFMAEARALRAESMARAA